MIGVFKKIIQIFLVIIGSVICINGLALFFVSNINLGNFLTVALGAVIIFTVVLFKKLAKLLKLLIIIALSVVFIFSSFLIIYGKTDNITYKEDAVIVLGAALHGNELSLSLKKRLDSTIEYYDKNPNALIIVSGGKGQGENATEADAMEKYLLGKGIPQENIIKECAATSTYENFTLSKKLLKERLGDSFTAAYITNEYHIFRAGLCAKQAGIKATTHLHSNTSTSYIVSGVLRECLAVVKYAVFKN